MGRYKDGHTCMPAIFHLSNDVWKIGKQILTWTQFANLMTTVLQVSSQNKFPSIIFTEDSEDSSEDSSE